MQFKPLEYIKRYFTQSPFSTQNPDTSYPQWMAKLINTAVFGTTNPENISPIFTSVRIISETLAKIPCHLIQRTPEGKIFLKDEPLYNLIRYAPNGYQTASGSRGNLETLRLFNGNSYQYINRKNGKPDSLDMIYPVDKQNSQNLSYMVGYKITDGELFYTVNRNGTLESINSDNVLHFKGAVSDDGILGTNPMDSIRRIITIMDNNYKTIISYAQNNLLTTKFIKSSVPINNKVAYDEILKNINKQNASPENSGLIVHLPPNAELQNTPLSFVDMEMISTLKWGTQQIAAVFGLPSFMLGESESLRFNNMEQMMLSFKMNTIQFIANMYEDQYNMKLLTQKQRDAGWEFEFDLNELVEIDYKTKMDGLKILKDESAINANQLAAIYGFPPHVGGDEYTYASNNESNTKNLKNPKEDPKTVNPDLND